MSDHSALIYSSMIKRHLALGLITLIATIGVGAAQRFSPLNKQSQKVSAAAGHPDDAGITIQPAATPSVRITPCSNNLSNS